MTAPLIAAVRFQLLRFWLCPSHRVDTATIRSLHFAILPACRAFDRSPASQRMQGYSIREQAQLIICPTRPDGYVAALFGFLHEFCRTSWRLILLSVPAFSV